MRKLIFALALVSSPAIAEDDIIAKARAELAEMQAKNRANEAKVLADNEALIKKLQDANIADEKKYGYIPSRPSWYFHSHVYVPTYVPTRRVICTRYGCR